MKTREIIKQSILFPIKYYKQFIIVTILFIISELTREHVLHNIPDDNVILMFLIHILLPLVVLGISLQIIFHAIAKKKGFPRMTLKKSLDEAVKDTILESYYFALTIIITTLLSIPLGIFRNINDISSFITNNFTGSENVNPIEVIGSTPDVLILNNLDPFVISLVIFIIMFIIMFSFCTIGKIDLEINHNFLRIFNLKYIMGKIKKIGITKYAKFLLLVIVICAIVANIVFFLNTSHIIGSILSAILESISLFFFLHSFAQLYPE